MRKGKLRQCPQSTYQSREDAQHPSGPVGKIAAGQSEPVIRNRKLDAATPELQPSGFQATGP